MFQGKYTVLLILPMIMTLVPPPPPPFAVMAGAAGFSTVAVALMVALNLRSMRAAVRFAACSARSSLQFGKVSTGFAEGHSRNSARMRD